MKDADPEIISLTRQVTAIGLFSILAVLTGVIAVQYNLPEQILIVFLCPVIIFAIISSRFTYASMLVVLNIVILAIIYFQSSRIGTASLESIAAVDITMIAVIELLRYLARARNRTDAALRKSEARYKHIFNSICDVYYEVAFDGTILEVSPSVRQLGYTPEELLGKSVSGFYVNPIDVAALTETLTTQRTLNDYEVNLISKDGSVCPWSVTARIVYDADGMPVNSVGTIRNISERKQQDEQKRKLEKHLQRLEHWQSIGVLTEGIANDFNNLLSGILGHAEVVEHETLEDSDAKKNLRAIEDLTHRASDLCQQLLFYGGEGEIIFRDVNIGETIDTVIAALQSRIPASVNVEKIVPDNLPSVSADRVQIRHLLASLIKNSIEALPKTGGTISVEAHTLAISIDERDDLSICEALQDGDFMCIEVSDTGTGIVSDIREEIFDPFFSTKMSGRGLGLAAVHGIVRAHQGAISVSSAQGQGTSIKIFLPVKHESIEPLKEVNESPASLNSGGGLILVVDDEVYIRTVCETLLKKSGYDVITADDGASAVAIFRERHADVQCVILDVIMPSMDGPKTLEALRKIEPMIPVIFISGHTQADLAEQLQGLDNTGFLLKPFKRARLVEAIELRKSQRHTPKLQSR